MYHGHDVAALTSAAHKMRDHQHAGIFLFEIVHPVGDQSRLPTTTFSRQEQNGLVNWKGIYSEKIKGQNVVKNIYKWREGVREGGMEKKISCVSKRYEILVSTLASVGSK